LFDVGDDLRLLVVENFFAADQIEREILGGLREPGGGILRDAVIGPGLKGADERFLDYVFSELQTLDAEDAREDGNELRRLVTEEVIGELGDCARGL
jgi:hypothetical protein